MELRLLTEVAEAVAGSPGGAPQRHDAQQNVTEGESAPDISAVEQTINDSLEQFRVRHGWSVQQVKSALNTIAKHRSFQRRVREDANADRRAVSPSAPSSSATEPQGTPSMEGAGELELFLRALGDDGMFSSDDEEEDEEEEGNERTPRFGSAPDLPDADDEADDEDDDWMPGADLDAALSGEQDDAIAGRTRQRQPLVSVDIEQLAAQLPGIDEFDTTGALPDIAIDEQDLYNNFLQSFLNNSA